ncbi:arginine--tRNA ligase [Paenibacillus methanolicus]|uniref:Arginine--tRNA ligase n=1 Tax=Paenibacillus methanolicus TaxID=582686 RepID=A0A5S5C5T5_9BACL|nr:arginine--tRNA ligase [Paenibacillus methanolicus]TYP74795.1 arginyl-tRNA synthetase [Paenibacillus methanolicus]
MQKYKSIIAREITKLLETVKEADIETLIEYPPNPEMGDLSLPCFKLSKQLRKPPQAIAEELKSRMKPDGVERIEAVSGYLNFYLDGARFASSVIGEALARGERYGSRNIGEGGKVVIDYSSPNIAKPFHIAHLRSTVIGNALYRIHDFLGFDCVGVNHLGDWGTQFGKLIVAYRQWGDETAVDEGGIDELLRLYVKFHEEAERDPSLEDEARGWFVRMEHGDEEALALWRRFVDISMAEFTRIYELLGVSFDSYAGESFYNGRMDPVVAELREKALLEADKGAWLVRLDAYDMPPALILKKDGSSLYHTRDITAALYRKETYDFRKAIYVTDYAQNLHFAQWFKVVELMGYGWAKDLVHVPFGRVSLEGASLSTRRGNVLKLEDVLNQAIAKTREIMESRPQPIADIETVSRQVGVGAVIFHDLGSGRIKDIDFKWEDVLNFEGESGPYVQYTHARACSVLAKAGAAGLALSEIGQAPDEAALAALPINEATLRLAKELSLFGERVELAMRKLEPSIVARCLVDLAQAFNRFYHECRIMAEADGVRTARLALVQAAKLTLANGLRLIGLEAPEQI